LNTILHGGATIDLSSSRQFAAHGLAGTVQSTMVLVLGRPHRSLGSAQSTLPPDVKRSQLAAITYRVTHVGGSAVASVRSSAAAAVCGPFDACGLQGMIDVVPGTTSGGSVYLSATAPVRRPKRDLLAALGATSRGNPSGIEVQGAGDASLRGDHGHADTVEWLECATHTSLDIPEPDGSHGERWKPPEAASRPSAEHERVCAALQAISAVFQSSPKADAP
jgi:hypothetical protein